MRKTLRIAFIYGPSVPVEDCHIDKVVDMETFLPHRYKKYEWGCKMAKKVYGDVHVSAVSYPIHHILKELYCDELDGAVALINVSELQKSPDDWEAEEL